MTTYPLRMNATLETKLDRNRTSKSLANNTLYNIALNASLQRLAKAVQRTDVDLKKETVSASFKKPKPITTQPLVSMTPPTEKNTQRRSKHKDPQQRTSLPIEIKLIAAIKQHQHVALAILKECNPTNLNPEDPTPFLYHPHRISCHAVSVNPPRSLTLP